jgi:dihydrolipoamide dehydrogenase
LVVAENAFDLIVIGSGPGGYVAAIRAAQLGMNVACVEKQTLGGTCLNVGCIPSKALLESSELFHQAETSLHVHGVKTDGVELDLARMMKRKVVIVRKMTAGIRSLFRKNKVTHIEGLGRLVGDGQVDVGGDIYSAKRILIATGSSSVELPGLPFDGEYVISSSEALSLEQVPPKMIVVGAGAIGLELGSVWNRLGAEVHVVEFLDRITPPMDGELSNALQKLLEKQGLSFSFETLAQSAEVNEGKVTVTLKQGEETSTEICDRLLVAVGRKPNTNGLGGADVGLEMDDKGRILVNEKFETNLPSVYAIGDVIPGPMLAHKAEEEGVAAVELMAGKAGHVNYDAIPNVVYTHPELASVGLNEEQVKEQGIPYKVGKFPFLANGRAHSLEATDGLVKIIAHEKTDRVLGIHILAARASDMLAEGVLAMEFSASAEDLARTMHAHPTMPEAIKEAALAVEKEAIHI